LLELKRKGAFGEIKEAEIHYDFESPTWLSKFPQKYTPGAGMGFGLGMLHTQGHHNPGEVIN
jgi:hypothetical protein